MRISTRGVWAVAVLSVSSRAASCAHMIQVFLRQGGKAGRKNSDTFVAVRAQLRGHGDVACHRHQFVACLVESVSALDSEDGPPRRVGTRSRAGQGGKQKQGAGTQQTIAQRRRNQRQRHHSITDASWRPACFVVPFGALAVPTLICARGSYLVGRAGERVVRSRGRQVKTGFWFVGACGQSRSELAPRLVCVLVISQL